MSAESARASVARNLEAHRAYMREYQRKRRQDAVAGRRVCSCGRECEEWFCCSACLVAAVVRFWGKVAELQARGVL